METIPMRYAELRRATEQVQDFLAIRLAWNGAYNLQLRIEDDFGLAGLDTASLLEEFAEQFRIDLSCFDFDGYISPEPGSDGAWLLQPVLLLLYLPLWAGAWATKVLLALLCAPFSWTKAREFWRLRLGVPDFILAPPPATPKVLRIGDLVASAAVGRFVQRETVWFELQRA